MPLHVMYPVRTDRLLLRPLVEADVTALLAYHQSAEVHQYLPVGPLDLAGAMDRLRDGPWAGRALETEGDLLSLGLELIADGTLIGDVMLRWLSAKDHCGEVGYVLHPEYVGLGYAAEATRALFRLGFDGLELHRIVARIDARNTASIRVAERLGMRREAHLVHNHWHDGWQDEIDFALLSGEWRSTLEAT
jgi:RimJ/RimL family protein N-acetyltransferase